MLNKYVSSEHFFSVPRNCLFKFHRGKHSTLKGNLTQPNPFIHGARHTPFRLLGVMYAKLRLI